MITNSNDGDVFHEEGKETEIEDKQWEKMMMYRLKDGFRDGMSEGHDSCLQNSFNQGFHDGFRSVHGLSVLRGISRTLCLKGVETDTSSKLYERLGELENTLLKALKESVNNQQKDTVTESQVFDLSNCDTQVQISNMSSAKLSQAKKSEIQDSFVELKGQCLEIARALDDSSLASTINEISF